MAEVFSIDDILSSTNEELASFVRQEFRALVPFLVDNCNYAMHILLVLLFFSTKMLHLTGIKVGIVTFSRQTDKIREVVRIWGICWSIREYC